MPIATTYRRTCRPLRLRRPRRPDVGSTHADYADHDADRRKHRRLLHFFYADPDQPPSEMPSDMFTTTPDTTTFVGRTDIYFDYADYYFSSTDPVFRADEF